MDRMKRIALAALVGTGALTGSQAAAQERGNGSYAVADDVARYGDRESRVRIPSGTDIAVTLDEDIPVQRDRFGDFFDAHVDRDVVVKGDVVIPAGAPARVKLVESSEKSDAATVRLAEVEVNGDMHQVSVGDARADVDEQDRNTGKKTAIGAAAGAIVGAVTGAGVLKGAVIGAGGGLAWSLLRDRGQAIGDDTTLRFELEEELDVN